MALSTIETGRFDASEARQADLDACFRAAAGSVSAPMGYWRGRTLILPGTFLGFIASRLYNVFWQGKSFAPDGRTLKNRVFGRLDLFPADVEPGISVLDGGPALLVDYGRRSLGARFLRDELRPIGPDRWLGRAYLQLGRRKVFVMNFMLEGGC